MKTGEILKEKGKEWIFVNGAYYINEPITGNIGKHITESFQKDNNYESFFDLILISKFGLWNHGL